MADPLADSRTFWDAHAERDPLWAVLSDAGKDGRRWNVRRFFQTGVNEVALVLYELESMAVHVKRGYALDFGCGVGRLSQALAARFERVVGVDVSPKMIEVATALNSFQDHVSYIWNDAPHLGTFSDDTFDFIYTNLVLQHVVPELACAYVREFIRILQPAGVLVFQLPSHKRQPEEPLPPLIATPMPDEAYQAALVVANLPQSSVAPDAEVTIDVDVTNVSELSWSQRQYGAIKIGNHWMDRSGADMLQRDDGRTVLPEMLPPGASCRVPLTIKMPTAEGDYQCEIDLAHEGVRWFRDRDSAVARFLVRVRAGGPAVEHVSNDEVRETARHADASTPFEVTPTLLGDPNVENPGDFPMFGVPTDVIQHVISACGGELLQKSDDHSCGNDWISFKYYVRKRARHS